QDFTPIFMTALATFYETTDKKSIPDMNVKRPLIQNMTNSKKSLFAPSGNRGQQ
ncbi:hypothetical protein STEG23_023384, partial [Scotinomys teguina]